MWLGAIHCVHSWSPAAAAQLYSTVSRHLHTHRHTHTQSDRHKLRQISRLHRVVHCAFRVFCVRKERGMSDKSRAIFRAKRVEQQWIASVSWPLLPHKNSQHPSLSFIFPLSHLLLLVSWPTAAAAAAISGQLMMLLKIADNQVSVNQIKVEYFCPSFLFRLAIKKWGEIERGQECASDQWELDAVISMSFSSNKKKYDKFQLFLVSH